MLEKRVGIISMCYVVYSIYCGKKTRLKNFNAYYWKKKFTPCTHSNRHGF